MRRLRSPHDREILRLALPALGALAAEPLYVLADTAIVGHLGRPQIAALIEEGVDALLIETCFDILQAKCVAVTAVEEMKRTGVRLPLMVQISPDDRTKGQTLLPGTEIPAALANSTGEELPAVTSATAKMIDIAQVQGQVHALSVQKVGELADRNPHETVSIIRTWLQETA